MHPLSAILIDVLFLLFSAAGVSIVLLDKKVRAHLDPSKLAQLEIPPGFTLFDSRVKLALPGSKKAFYLWWQIAMASIPVIAVLIIVVSLLGEE